MSTRAANTSSPTAPMLLELAATEEALRATPALLAVEHAGSLQAAMDRGLISEKPAVLQRIWQIVPASRGGLARGVEAERAWQLLIDEIVDEMGGPRPPGGMN